MTLVDASFATAAVEPDGAEALGAVIRTALAEHDGVWLKARPAVLAELKRFRQAALRTAEAELLRSGDGLDCARAICRAQDAIVTAITEAAMQEIYPFNPSSTERIAVLATGGYGRCTLAPGSDIDLLFLLSWRQTPWTENIIETVLYMLWDMGLKLGHATRNVDDCIRLARSDITIRTALLETRLICGDAPLTETLERRFDTAVARGTGPEFIAAKLTERDERHRRQGQSRYLVEPNVKEGKGALRDLNTLFWIAKYFYRVKSNADLVSLGVFSEADNAIFADAEDFLWAVRCHLHFLTGRPEERLSFDVQRDVAARMGFEDGPGLSAVERFMKRYFLVAKDVGDLTRILCSALEEEHVKQTPRLNRFLRSLAPITRREVVEAGDFVVEHQRINIADEQVFVRDPVNVLRIFRVADRYELGFHPNAMRILRGSLGVIDDALRANPEANRIFLDVLMSRDEPENMLRRMNESGVLGLFVPDFGKVVAMMQFNMYHHYTVDEHLIRAIGILSRIDCGELKDQHPLASSLIGRLQNRRVLYVALFLHDIAKGRVEDHSEAGAAIARTLGPRLGLSAAETETVAWLVETHLVMSITAQQRDLSDPKTIRDFAELVQTPERLRLLEVLTEADIAAVGPGIWNGWKSQLLNVLYDETEPVLTAGDARPTRRQRVAGARHAFTHALADWAPEAVGAYVERHGDPYMLRVDLPDKLAHARLIRSMEQRGERVAFDVRLSAERAITQITIAVPDLPRLLALIAGACAVSNANIVSAEIFTTRDGIALDTIGLSRAFPQDTDEQRRAQRICDLIRKGVNGAAALPAIVEQRLPNRISTRPFHHETDVGISNDWSERYTVIEISGLDRPGLLYDITQAMSDLSLDIRSAQLATFGERAVQVFYVQDADGHKIAEGARRELVRERLTRAFDHRLESPTNA